MKLTLNKEILRLAIPNIISNISIPLLSTVDTVLMGQLSAVHIGAVGIASMIFNFVYWNFGFLRMGTTGFTAQAFGAQSDVGIRQALTRALGLSFLLALLILLFQGPLSQLGIYLMNVEGTHLDLVLDYFFIRIWAAPATLALYVLMGWYFGMQNAVYPLFLAIFINVLNIVCSSYFVLYQGMDVAGVAWGTVISQYAGLVLALVLMLWKYPSHLMGMDVKFLQDLKAMRSFLKVNSDFFIRTICLTIAFGFFYSQSAKGGELILAANVILLQLLNWMSYGIDGFAYASESMVGKYFGARDSQKVKETIKLSMVWGAVLALGFSLVYGVFGDFILSIFSSDVQVLKVAGHYMHWMVILPVVGFASYIWDGVFVGFTASRAMRDTMLLSFVAYVILFYFSPIDDVNVRLWIALCGFLFFRGLLQSLWYFYKGLSLK